MFVADPWSSYLLDRQADTTQHGIAGALVDESTQPAVYDIATPRERMPQKHSGRSPRGARGAKDRDKESTAQAEAVEELEYRKRPWNVPDRSLGILTR